MRAHACLLAVALTSLACTERARLTALPPDVTRVVVVRTQGDGAESVSPLIDVSDGVLSLAVEGDDTVDLWGYGDELEPLLAGVPGTRYRAERMVDADTCDSALPAARWARHLAPDRSLSDAPPPRTWTAPWLTDQCPTIDPASLRPALSCVTLSCGRTTRSGCNISVDLTTCRGESIPGRILADGRVCFEPRNTSELGICEPRTDTPPGALGSLSCSRNTSENCRIDLYDSPEDTTIRVSPLVIGDSGPAGLGPSGNDAGINSSILRRMRAVPWGDDALMVTWWPWASWNACRRGHDVTPTHWSLVDLDDMRVTATGTTSTCIFDLGKIGPMAAIALTRPADNAWALTRLDANAREEAARPLDDMVARLGEPVAMATTASGDAVVLYGTPDLFSGQHSIVVHDGGTLEPGWESARLGGAATFLRIDGNTAWMGNASERAIETVELGIGNYQRPYEIPELILEPLEIGGMLLPEPDLGRELMVLLLRDVPGILVTQPTSRTLEWMGPYQRERAYVTAIGRNAGTPVVMLMSRDDDLAFTAHMVTIDPITRRWRPGSNRTGLRVVSELVVDGHNRTWAIAPWDGLIARLPKE